MKRFLRYVLVVSLIPFGVTACGGSTEPNNCAVCGTWYLESNPSTGLPMAHDANWTLVLNPDDTFSQGNGPSRLRSQGWYVANSTQLTLEWDNYEGNPPSGTPYPVGAISGGKITFPPSPLHSSEYIYTK